MKNNLESVSKLKANAEELITINTNEINSDYTYNKIASWGNTFIEPNMRIFVRPSYIGNTLQTKLPLVSLISVYHIKKFLNLYFEKEKIHSLISNTSVSNEEYLVSAMRLENIKDHYSNKKITESIANESKYAIFGKESNFSDICFPWYAKIVKKDKKTILLAGKGEEFSGLFLVSEKLKHFFDVEIQDHDCCVMMINLKSTIVDVVYNATQKKQYRDNPYYV